MMGLALTGVAVIAFFAIWHFKGASTAAYLAVLLACSLSTVELYTFSTSAVLTATAPASVSITTVSLALIGAFLALPAQTVRHIPVLFFLFVIGLTVLTMAQGALETHVVSGILQWTSAIVAWGVGAAIAVDARANGRPTARTIAYGGAFVVACHGVAAALQVLGVRAVSAIEVGAMEVSRASGIAGHSGNLGKIMFVVTMFLLPLTRSADRIARRWAIIAVIGAGLLTGLSFSRANTAAVAALIGLWLLLGPGIGLAKRVLIPLVAIVVAYPIIELLLLRNEYDPEGGSRPILMETALAQISQTLWFGVGPNRYLEVVGRYDPMAAGGLPVHSGFLLALAELGLVCAVLLLVPLLTAVLRSARSAFTRGSPVAAYGVVLLASVPGVILIAGTGWGIIRGQFLVLLFFAIGYLVGAQSDSNAAAGLRQRGERAYAHQLG